MMKKLIVILSLILMTATQALAWRLPWAKGTEESERIVDLYFSEALYQAYQQNWFTAISHLDTELAQHYLLDEPQLDSLFSLRDDAEFNVGDFELSYRMHQRAGRALNAVIDSAVTEQQRNAALYRLARIYFQKEQPVNALHALQRIEGKIPVELKEDLSNLKAQVLLANGRFSEAIEVLKSLQGSEQLKGFAGYNLGIALLFDGQSEAALKQLEATGLLQGDGALLQALKDRTNLVLGDRLLATNQHATAKTVFDRISLEGAFSSRSLLGSGWANAREENFELALIPWTLLSRGEVTDEAVQEGMLAVPYAYGKLGIFGRAALLYGNALEAFSGEIETLTQSITRIREGHFLTALRRQELTLDSDWLVNLRRLPQSPETHYLTELMAAHRFQEALKNYLDLDQLERKLESWRIDLDAYEQIIQQRRAYYEPLLPEIDARFLLLDAQMRLRLEQRQLVEQRLNGLLTSPRPELLMTTEERIARERLFALQQQPSLSADELRRVERIEGIILWQTEMAYDERQTDAFENLFALDSHIEQLEQSYHSFVRIRQAATQGYQNYDATIKTQRIRIHQASEKVVQLQKRQGHLLNTMAINELKRRRERLEEFQIKARFAMADSYDRAVRNKQEQAREEEQVEP
jgi:predicted negative regulator of RcsB-dependent stress response